MAIKADQPRAMSHLLSRIDEVLRTRRCVNCGDRLGASNPVAFVVSDIGVCRKRECQDLILQLTVGELADAGATGQDRNPTPHL
jgi:hypothetical protein